MELRVIRYFMAVANNESISRAAQFLHISQPTLSRQIKDLEDELGSILFIRGKRSLALTDKGKLFRKRAEEILDLVNKTEAEFHSINEIISGDLYIGGGETEAVGLIAKIAKSLHDDYPDIRFHLYSGNSDDVSERIDKGLLDFGILFESVGIKKYDYLRLPSKDTWGLLMRNDSPLIQYETIRPEDMYRIPLIISRNALFRNELSGWLGYDFERLNIISTYNLIYNASLMVEQGLGCALCLDKLVNTTGDSILCFKPLTPSLQANLFIVWKKHQIFSKAADEFIKRVRLAINA